MNFLTLTLTLIIGTFPRAARKRSSRGPVDETTEVLHQSAPDYIFPSIL